MNKRRLLRILPLAAVLAAALSACTVYVRPGQPGPVGMSVPLNDVITTFQPTRGDGAVYQLGDTIQFRIRTNESGYVTLSAMDPDGRVYVFARNIFVPAYHTLILPTREMRVTFSAAPPTGFHRVRAAFTSGPTDPGRVHYSGRFGASAWTAAIDLDIRSFHVRDVAETTLIIR
jgi:hypothetical protein